MELTGKKCKMEKEKIIVPKYIYELLEEEKQTFNKSSDYIADELMKFSREIKWFDNVSNEVIAARFLNDEIEIAPQENAYFWYSKEYDSFINYNSHTHTYSLSKRSRDALMPSQIAINSPYDILKFTKFDIITLEEVLD